MGSHWVLHHKASLVQEGRHKAQEEERRTGTEVVERHKAPLLWLRTGFQKVHRRVLRGEEGKHFRRAGALEGIRIRCKEHW